MGRQMIFLIGMPAAGKTYWGKRLSEKLGWKFTDLDAFVTENEKATVPALFAMYGEAGFREREHKWLHQLISENTMPAVIACGGGTPCYFDNIALMKAAGVVVYIQVATPVLMQRLFEDSTSRPLVSGKSDIEVYLNELLDRRRYYYEQAHFTLAGEEVTVDGIAKLILL